VEADDLVGTYKATRARGFGPEVKRRIMLGTYALSAGYYDAYYLKALKVRSLVKRDFDRAFERVDYLLTPTSPTVPFKLGDRVPIKGTIFQGLWEFNVRAIYTGTRQGDDETQFWFHKKYLEENGPDFFKGLIGWYTVKVANPDEAAAVGKSIDARFANSSFETKTEPEMAFAASFVKQMNAVATQHSR
jgi:hypothetical protein